MALSVEKCKFAQKKVEYLGYEVTPTGIKPLPRKLQVAELLHEILEIEVDLASSHLYSILVHPW